MRKTSPFEHRHRWTAIATVQAEESSLPKPTSAASPPTTLLLRRCRCGEFDAVKLLGTWPAELFTGRPPAIGWGDWLMIVLSVALAIDNAARGFPLVAAVWSLAGLYGGYLMLRAWWRRRHDKAAAAASPVADRDGMEQGS